jgi:hypothetical protein
LSSVNGDVSIVALQLGTIYKQYYSVSDVTSVYSPGLATISFATYQCYQFHGPIRARTWYVRSGPVCPGELQDLTFNSPVARNDLSVMNILAGNSRQCVVTDNDAILSVTCRILGCVADGLVPAHLIICTTRWARCLYLSCTSVLVGQPCTSPGM